MLNHRINFKSLQKAGLRSLEVETMLQERGWGRLKTKSEAFPPSAGPGPFLLQLKVGRGEPQTIQKRMLVLVLCLQEAGRQPGSKQQIYGC